MVRFQIRDVLWLTLVVAVALCWHLDRERVRKSAERDKELVQRVRAVFGKDLDGFLSRLEAKPARTSPKVVSVKIKSPGKLPKHFDYQPPPRRPRRISDEEQPTR